MTLRKTRFTLLSLVVAGLVAGWFWRDYQVFVETPLAVPPNGMVIRVEPGDSVRSVVQSLARKGVTVDTWKWRVLTRRHPVTILAGEYALEQNMTPTAMLDTLASGKVLLHFFTIVEGWNYRQLRDALLSNEVLTADPERILPDRVMAELGTDEQHPEGWFLPETYAVVRGDTALDVLGRAYQDMRTVLAATWDARQEGLPLDHPYELLTLASIVEKETSVAAEYTQVAGVFTRRLQQRWRLETDPTVIYGMGENYNGDIRRRDLKTDTPYNTYTNYGLPPTPISMPGAAALQASANPTEGSSMFFVADGAGGHVFSDTLEQHNRAVQALLKRRKTQ